MFSSKYFIAKKKKKITEKILVIENMGNPESCVCLYVCVCVARTEEIEYLNKRLEMLALETCNG